MLLKKDLLFKDYVVVVELLLSILQFFNLELHVVYFGRCCSLFPAKSISQLFVLLLQFRNLFLKFAGIFFVLGYQGFYLLVSLCDFSLSIFQLFLLSFQLDFQVGDGALMGVVLEVQILRRLSILVDDVLSLKKLLTLFGVVDHQHLDLVLKPIYLLRQLGFFLD